MLWGKGGCLGQVHAVIGKGGAASDRAGRGRAFAAVGVAVHDRHPPF